MAQKQETDMNGSVETFAAVGRLAKAEYAPYHRMAGFWYGVNDYPRRRSELRGVDAQAYDRGLECAMRVRIQELRRARPVG
jgi:hypothetical protein